MKDKLLNIINELSKKEHFDACFIDLTINLEPIIGFDQKRFKKHYDDVLKIINLHGDISSYNFTLIYKEGDFEEYTIWTRTEYIFYDNDDSDEYGSFDWRTSGNNPRESTVSHGIGYALRKYENYEEKYGNNYEYIKLPELLDNLIQLNSLFNKQQVEKNTLYKKISLFI